MSGASVADKRSFDLRELRFQLLFIAFALGVPFGLGTSPMIFRDGDVSWHIAAGRWILQHGRIPTTDPFSFSAAGHPWIATEWLAEVVYSSAFNIAGYSGLAVVVAMAMIAIHSILFFCLERRSSPLVIAITLLAMDLVLGRFVLARPHVLAWLLLTGWTVLLVRTEETGKPPPLWSALILVFWTNVHASFPAALLIAGAIGLDTLIKTRWRHLREWMLFGLVSVIALMLNANGIGGLLQPFRISSLSMLGQIGEWHSSSPKNSPIFFGVLLLGLGALNRSGIRIPIGRLALLLALIAMAIAHVRHQALFVLVAACVIPPLLQTKPSNSRVPKWFLAAALPLLAFRAFVPMTPPETAGNPWHLLRAIPPQLRAQPVFNEYSFGGPLILAGIKPYIDGRAELYGDSYVDDYIHMTEGDFSAFQRAIARFNIQWVILPWDEKYLLRNLAASGDWCKIYADKLGMIAVRKASLRSCSCQNTSSSCHSDKE